MELVQVHGTMLISPAENGSKRRDILALPHLRDAGIFSQLIELFFNREMFSDTN